MTKGHNVHQAKPRTIRRQTRNFLRVFSLVPADAADLPDGYLTVDDAAAWLGCTAPALRARIESGVLEAVREEGAPGPEGWRWIVRTGDLAKLKS